MRFTSIVSGALVLGFASAKRSKPLQSPASEPVQGSMTSAGCFSEPGDFTAMLQSETSSGSCRELCMQMRLQYTVIGLQGKNCLCGNAYPPKDSLVEDEKCNYPCPAFGMEACGSIGNPKHYTVFNLGIDIDVPYADPDAASSTPSSTHSSTPVETPSGSGTLIGSPKPTESDDNSSAGFNLAKITATVFGLAAAVAGVACL